MNPTEAPAWVGITFLIYCILFDAMVLGGAGYAVFVLGYSGWWILAAFVICSFGFQPKTWRQLWATQLDENEEEDQ